MKILNTFLYKCAYKKKKIMCISNTNIKGEEKSYCKPFKANKEFNLILFVRESKLNQHDEITNDVNKRSDLKVR